MMQWVMQLVRMGKRAEGTLDLGSEAYDVLEAYGTLLKEEVRWGTVPRAMKNKARSELGEFTMRMGKKIDGFPET